MPKKPLVVPVSIEDLFGDFGDVSSPAPAPAPEPEPPASPEPEPLEPVVEVTPAPTSDEVAVEFTETGPPRPPYVRDQPPSVSKEGWRHYLDCGHSNFASKEAQEAARAAGFCCVDGKKKRVVASWTALRGPYLRPLPANIRRTREKERGLGFPGYCCDDEGWYIGGIGNNCVMYRPAGAPLCRAHRPPSADPPPPPEPEENEAPTPEIDLEETVGAPDAPKLTMKQRQMAARKKGRKS